MIGRAANRTGVAGGPHRRGFTLMEVMVALAVTAMIGAGVSAMLISVSESTRFHDDVRRHGAEARLLRARLNASIRGSRMILAADADTLVLWTADSRRNGSPDLSELRRVEWSGAARELTCYASPPGLPESADPTYDVASDFQAITASLMGTARFPGSRWGADIADWSPTPDDPDPRKASLVSYRLTVGEPGAERTSTDQAALRGW